MNADRARKLAIEAAREADRAEAHAWSLRMKALADPHSPRQPSRNVSTGLRLARSEMPQVLNRCQNSFGCRPPTPQHANLEVGSGAQMPVVPNAAVFAACTYDQAYRIS
jgi:hypothetical protein